MKIMLMYFVGKNGKESIRIIYVYYLRHVSSSSVLNASVADNDSCLFIALFLQVDLVPSIIWFFCEGFSS